MDDPKQYVYAKFKVETDSKIMESMIISQDKSAIDEWIGESREPKKKKETEYRPASSTFQDVTRSFLKSVGVFQDSIAFIMNTMPFMRRALDDRSIRGFIKENGDLLESGSFEVYRLGVDHFQDLSKRLEQSDNMRLGIRSLPNMFILGLISAYDVFLSTLIRSILITRPEFLSSSERNISFKDLMEIGSVEAAREQIIEKEIESVIRTSHHEQITWLEKKLEMPLTKGLSIWPDFIELCERRNLLTHTAGAVSTQYLKVCKQHGFDTKDVAVGHVLRVDGKYFRRAIRIILEIGSKLTRVIWRKLLPQEIELADRELNRFA